MVGRAPPVNPSMDNRFTILIPYRNGQAYMVGLLASIPADIPVLVIDDASPQPYIPPQTSQRSLYQNGSARLLQRRSQRGNQRNAR